MNKSSSAKASQIKPNQYYFTYWHGDKGERDKPVFKVNLTQTVGRPWGCQSTWCLFTNGANVTTAIPYDVNIDRLLESAPYYPYWYKKYTR